MADRVGQQLGNYRLLRLLGEGGFAQVYLGEQVYLKTLAAIKVLHTRLAQDDLESFLNEARTIAALKHPHIVRVLDFGVEGGTPFLVMDYAAGGTLRQRLPKGTPLSPAAILPAVRQVAEALQYAHDLRLIHRDVKPENMLLGERGEVLLSDFGIAIVSQSSRYQSTQDSAGTIAYMAPEQIQGHPRPASDQYSLGIVVYEWLAGERPFTGSLSEVVAQHLGLQPSPLRQQLPSIPPAVEQVVFTALAKDPKARFPSVQDFAAAFEQASQRRPSARVSPASAMPLTTMPEAPSPPTRRRSAWEESTPAKELPEPPAQFAPTQYPPRQQAEPAQRSRTSPPTPPLASTVPAAAPPERPATPASKWAQASEPPPLPPTFSGSIRRPAALRPSPLPAQPERKTPRNRWVLAGMLVLVLVLVLGVVGLGFAGKGPLASLGTRAMPRPPLGTIKEFVLSANSGPGSITKGPDGNLWFTEQSDAIGRITPEGKITEFALPTAHDEAVGITVGPDGNLWFTECVFDSNEICTSSQIGRITPEGKITEFALPANSGSGGITAGPDGNLWFTECVFDSNEICTSSQIGRITPEGKITEFAVPTANSDLAGIAAGPDGNLWFTEESNNTEQSSNKIGRITPEGKITEFALPPANSQPLGITAGPDGNLWFTEGIYPPNDEKIGRITPEGSISEFALPSSDTSSWGITTGPDGNLWFTEVGNKIGWISPGP